MRTANRRTEQFDNQAFGIISKTSRSKKVQLLAALREHRNFDCINFEKECKLQKINQLLKCCSDELFDLVEQVIERACSREVSI